MDQYDLNLDNTRTLRAEIQKKIDLINNSVKTRSSALAITKLEEAKMWLGKHMGEIGGEDLNAQRDANLTSNPL